MPAGVPLPAQPAFSNRPAGGGSVQYIDIQYADGRDERIKGDDLAGRWDEVTEDTAGIQYAGYFVPKRGGGGGHRAQGVFGITRDEAAALGRARRQERAQRAARAAEAMY